MKLPLNIDWQQILLHALNLVILVGGLYALLFKPVKKFMDQRAENYQKMKADAEDAKAQAESLKAELSERMKQADAEAQTYRQEAMAKAEKPPPRWIPPRPRRKRSLPPPGKRRPTRKSRSCRTRRTRSPV